MTRNRIILFRNILIGVSAFTGLWMILTARMWGHCVLLTSIVVYSSIGNLIPSKTMSPLLKTILNSLVLIFLIYGLGLYMSGYFAGLIILFLSLACFLSILGLEEGRSKLLKLIFRNLKHLSLPISGFIIAMVVGFLVIWFSGFNPLSSYAALLYGGFVKNWSISVLNATPLIFTGLSVAFAFRAGLFNIGAEGQYYVSAIVATFLGLHVNISPVVNIILIILLSGLSGAMWNYVPSLLKVKTGASEVITTMMLANVAIFLSPVFIKAMGGDPATSEHAYVTDTILEANWIPSC